MTSLPARILLLALVLLSACAVPRSATSRVVQANPTPALAVSNPNHAALPLDESPHGDLTEWWYYTGHLAADDGRHYGFEVVFFQIRRGDAPPGYAAHFAITDDARGSYQFDERTGSGEQGGRGLGFDLHLSDWGMQGNDDVHHLVASMADYAIDLGLRSDKPAVLHNGTGLIDFGPFGASYYYSRTRMDVRGTIRDHGQDVPTRGIAWMDHQWGNFIVGSVGGWDWYAIQLDDGTDIMLSFNRGADGKQYVSYGTYVEQSGQAVTLPDGAFAQQSLGSWTSPATNVRYPSGWRVLIPSRDLDLTLIPTARGQELVSSDPGSTTYWEGEVRIDGSQRGAPVHGQGYVELTGYRR